MTGKLSAEEHPTYPSLPEPGEWLSQYGDALHRYALARLRRSNDTSKVVQETLLAAFTSRSQFQGRSHW
jgi:DNA-directed RNA polymerase specialized sigma24 family protein